MGDAVENQVEGTGEKKLGRNQKLAAVGYLIPFAAVVVPSLGSMVAAVVHSDTATQMAVIDKLVAFGEVYGLVAVASVLVVSGAIKSVAEVAGAISRK